MKDELDAIADHLRATDRFLILSHVKPDGDALGTSFALLGALLEQGKSATLFLGEPIPDNYREFQPENVIVGEPFRNLEAFSSCVCVDVSNPDRIDTPAGCDPTALPTPLVNIDHHPDNARFGDLNGVDPAAAATAEIMIEMFNHLRWPISSSTSTRLLLGMVMDTGCFRFDNTDPAALEATAELLRRGADHHRVVERMFHSKPMKLIQLEADLAANHLRTACDGKFIWMRLPDEILARHGVALKDTEGLIDLVRSVNGPVIAGLIRPQDDGYKISLRSKEPTRSVGAVARRLNGGGHEMAAGGFIKADSFADAESVLIDHVAEILK